MTEPHATTAAATWALGTITVTGMIFGMHLDALIIGFIAALFGTLHLPISDPPRSPYRLFSMAVGAAFCAGLFSPIASAAAINYMTWPISIGEQGLRVASAGLLGLTINVGLPLIFDFMARKGKTL